MLFFFFEIIMWRISIPLRPAPLFEQTRMEFKEKGNLAFNQGNYREALQYYTIAIEKDPSNVVFYSNRSAAYLMLQNFQAALDDANIGIEKDSAWAKVRSFSSHLNSSRIICEKLSHCTN